MSQFIPWYEGTCAIGYEIIQSAICKTRIQIHLIDIFNPIVLAWELDWGTIYSLGEFDEGVGNILNYSLHSFTTNW